MKYKWLVIWVTPLLFSCYSAKPTDHLVTNEQVTIPFTLTEHNNISIEAIINGRDTVNLMFHTAASTIDLTESSALSMTSLLWDKETEINTWGGKAAARSSQNNTLEISHLKWDSLRIWENQNSGPTTDGKFGPNLFSGKVIEINFDKNEISLHESIPEPIKGYYKAPLIFENELMFIECKSTINEDDYPNRFLIHSGYGGTILYDDAFVIKSKIGNRIKINSQKELKDAHDNIITVNKGTIPSFTIGHIDFQDMPVGFFEGAIGRQKMSVLGGDLLKRFNIIIDKKREFIYLKANEFKEGPYSVI